jgi:hypothetical protein
MTNDHDSNQLARLAERLVDGTRLRSIEWRAAEPEVYTWGTGEGSVTIASRDRDGDPPYELTVYNTESQKVDELSSDLLPGDVPAPWNPRLADLYAVARRSALRADDIIDALMAAVQVPGVEEPARPERSFLSRARGGASDADVQA